MGSLIFIGLLTVFLQHKNSSAQTDVSLDKQSVEEIQRAQDLVDRDFPEKKDVNGEIDSLGLELQSKILAQYSHLDPKKEIPPKLLQIAVLFFDANKLKFGNQKVLTVVNLGARSNSARFFLVHLDSGSVEKFHTTHGVGSDDDNDGYAERFGNEVGSGKSSLGFVRTAEVYVGNFKRSLRLDGLSSSNSNLRERAVVVHGWDDVKEEDTIQGRTLGCLALDWNIKDALIDQIKDGSLIYVGCSGEFC